MIPVKVYKTPQLKVFLIFYIIFQWFEVSKLKNIHCIHRHSSRVWKSNFLNIKKASDCYSYINTQKKPKSLFKNILNLKPRSL